MAENLTCINQADLTTVVWLWRKDNLIVSGTTNERFASTFLIQNDGNLIAGANSPFDVFSNSLWYAGFTQSQDSVYFGGNTFLQVYDNGPKGGMDLDPNSGLPTDGLALGLSVAPEMRDFINKASRGNLQIFTYINQLIPQFNCFCAISL